MVVGHLQQSVVFLVVKNFYSQNISVDAKKGEKNVTCNTLKIELISSMSPKKSPVRLSWQQGAQSGRLKEGQVNVGMQKGRCDFEYLESGTSSRSEYPTFAELGPSARFDKLKIVFIKSATGLLV